MGLLQVLDLLCILLALAISGLTTIAPDLSVFDDYTGATLFTIFFYMLFFYILDVSSYCPPYNTGCSHDKTNIRKWISDFQKVWRSVYAVDK